MESIYIMEKYVCVLIPLVHTNLPLKSYIERRKLFCEINYYSHHQPTKKHDKINGDTWFQIIIDGVLQSHIKRFAIDIDDEKIRDKSHYNPKGISYVLEKYLNNYDYYEDDSDKVRDDDEWSSIINN